MATRKREDDPPSTKPGHRMGGATAAARSRSITPRPSASPVRRLTTPPEAGEDAKKRRSEAPTLPPPPPKASGVRSKRKTMPPPAATVDEVIADMSRDPRRERDDEDD